MLRPHRAQSLWRIELPLAWTGLLTAAVLTFAHTLGEFGVVLMVGGSIPGETKTIALAIYDRVQGFDMAGAGRCRRSCCCVDRRDGRDVPFVVATAGQAWTGR